MQVCISPGGQCTVGIVRAQPIYRDYGMINCITEFRSCVKVEVAVLGSPS